MLIALLWTSIPAFAYDFELPAGNGMQKLQYSILSSVDQTVSVVGGTTGKIPCKVTYNNKNYTVTEIGRYAFNDVNITDYRLPLSLKAIRENAFGFSKASTIAIPDGVEIIETGAFWYSSVETIIIGSGVKNIGYGAFCGCNKLKTIVFRPQKAPNHESRNYSIGNRSTTVIVPQLSGYEGTEIAEVIAGTMIEPIHFKQNQFEYSGKIPTLEYVLKINTASTYDMNLKNKDAGTYEQVFRIGLSQVIPSYGFSDFDGYSVFPDRGVDVLYEYSITKKPLFVKIVNSQRMYGEPNPSSFAYTIEGFVDGEDENQLLSPIKCETTASIQSPVGSYPITSNPSALNYSFEIQQGLLNIQKAPINIVIHNSSKTYGDENPTYQYDFIGLRCGDTDPEITSVLQFTNIDKSSNCGEYSISILSGELRNYYINNIQSGTLSIIPAPMLLKVQNAQKTYYEKNPDFKFLLEGLRNNDDESCLSKTPTFTCTATINSDCGQYSIVPSSAEAKNYLIEYQNGTLSISPRQLTASVGKYSKTYGTDNPQFDVTYDGFVNNEDKSVLASQVIATCSAGRDSDVGTYPIKLAGGDAVNYVISKYNNGVLSIEKADQTLIWNQDLSNISLYSQIALEATSSVGLPVTYEMSPNNVATLYDNGGKLYLDCYRSGAVNIRAIQNGDKNHNPAAMLSKTLVVRGSGGDPSNPQIFLNIETAGSLPTLIAENRKYQIKNLRLSGYLNGTDINYLREMAGSDRYGKTTPGVLEALDISECTIVSGGGSYYNSCRTSDYKVGDYMFYNCKVLNNLLLPDNSKTIGEGAFAECERLSVIAIPNNVTSFGQQAFKNCISFLRIPMPNKLTSIGDMAFIGCNGITEITLPASVSYIGDRIVKDCQNIERINVESGNTNFASKNGVLYTSSFDELLIFPIGYTDESYKVFESATKIAPFAFVNAKKLKNLTLPKIMASIGKDAFIGCVNLSTLQVQAITPPICDNDCFESVSKTRCELQVPQGCYSYYWVAPVWADFNKIIETDFAGIDEVECEQQVSIDGRNIKITGVGKGLNVRIFQTDGTLLYQYVSDGNVVLYQPSACGIYIIAVGNQIYKIAIR